MLLKAIQLNKHTVKHVLKSVSKRLTLLNNNVLIINVTGTFPTSINGIGRAQRDANLT